jgi:tetratricopeptide (TPR) repeat protein
MVAWMLPIVPMRWVLRAGSIRSRAAAGYVLICLGAMGAGLAGGQSRAARPSQRGPSGVPPTISVASLKIPESAWIHYEKAREAAQENRIDEYERETRKALYIAPAFAEVYVLRASYEMSMRRYDAAIADAVEARRIQPGVAWAGVILAGAYNGAHRYVDASVIAGNLHGSEADTWQAKYERARAAIGRGDVEGALRWSASAVATAPENCADVHLLRANALSMTRRWPAAIVELETYLDLDKGPQHRAEVLVLLERTRGLAREQARAGRGPEGPASR